MAKEFKLIVAGGRTFDDARLLDTEIRKVIAELPDSYVVSIISGMAKGADILAHKWAREIGCKCYEFPADWESFGKRAGFIRNKEMANEGHGLLAFWDGASSGTNHMITTSINFQLEFVRVIPYGTSNGKVTTYKSGVLDSLRDK
jgi:hypothetical protein